MAVGDKKGRWVAPLGTSTRMPGECLHLLFLQAHRENEAHFTVSGMPSHRNQSDSFCFNCDAFYQSLKSKVGLVWTKAAALQIILIVEGSATRVPVVVGDKKDRWVARRSTYFQSSYSKPITGLPPVVSSNLDIVAL